MLSKTTQEQIKIDAEKVSSNLRFYEGYIKGATDYAERAQQLEEALKEVVKILDSLLDIQPNSELHRWIKDKLNNYRNNLK